MALGESATIPDNGFECVRTALFASSYVHVQAAGGWINPSSHAQSPAQDVLISDCLVDLLTSSQYGFNFAPGDFDATSLAQYKAYQQAQGLFFSPLLVSQEKATEVLDRWATLSNAWIYWIGTAIQFVPLGDQALSANGAIYTPWGDVAYDLGPSDFLPGKDEDDPPVKVTIVDPADAHNRTVLDFTDRTLAYIDNPGRVEGRRAGQPSTACGTTPAPRPTRSATRPWPRSRMQLLGKRKRLRPQDLCVQDLGPPRALPSRHDLDPDRAEHRAQQVPGAGVKTVAGDDKGQLSFTCEECPGTIGIYVPPTGAVSANPAQTPNLYAAPPAVNTPAIVEPSSALTGGVAKIIVAASGGANWGGCMVQLSFDGVDYSQVGEITAAARQGLLTAALGAYAGANPDTTDTLAVDCTESLGTPTTVSHADAQAYRTLSLVAAQPTLSGSAYVVPAGELLAFGSVAATGTYAANLTYLERGLYGSSAAAHASGAQFTVLNVAGTDGTSIAFSLPTQYIGQPIYLKLLSYNLFGNVLQDPSTAVEYQYTPGGVWATAEARRVRLRSRRGSRPPPPRGRAVSRHPGPPTRRPTT